MSRLSSRIALIGVGAVLVAAGVAGCGGGDDDSGEALTKDDYIAQANEICADLTAEIEGFGDFGAAYASGDFEGASQILSDGNETINATLDDLKGLTPPEEDQATIDEFLSLNDQSADVSEKMADAAAEGDDATLKSHVDELDALQTQSDLIADDYGMAECGSAGNA